MTVGDRILGDARTRAERVRARRARQQRAPLDTGELRTPKPRRKSRRRRRARRRYDLALPVELGAEIRLPALPAIKTGPRLVSTLLLGLLLLLARSMVVGKAFEVVEAEVEGNQLLTAQQVISIAQADQNSAVLIDPAAAEARFEEVPEVAAAQVRMGWPNRVLVSVEERKPLVAWKDGYRDWWLSEEGVAFLKHGEREGLVHIESETPVLSIQRDPLAQVIDPQVLVAAGVLQAQAPEVDRLLYDPVRGLGFEDPRGWTAYFGTEGDMVMKYRLYRAIIEHLEAASMAPSLVSVRDPSAPYYRQ